MKHCIRFAAAIAVLAAACSPSEVEPPACPTGSAVCGGACTAIANDPLNCGACGNACPAPLGGGAAACIAGKCNAACATGQTACGAAEPDGGPTFLCTTLATDGENCGTCGNVCPPQQHCTAGSCSDCTPGNLRCNGACIPVESDNQNCGGCGNVCAQGTACQNGACLAPGLTNCGTPGGNFVSTDLQSDRSNCGACGNVCGASEVCSGGHCAGCPVSQCNDACVDTQHDPQNCGACGGACTGTQACINGACGAAISIAVLPPASGGVVAADAGVAVQVSSQYRLAGVTVDGPPYGTLDDGGVNRHADLALASAPLEVNPTLWTVTLPDPSLVAAFGWDGGMTFTATDEAFRADAGDGSLHEAQTTAFVHVVQQLSGASFVPVFSAQAGNVRLANGSFVPLDQNGGVTLTAAYASTPSGVAAVQFTSSLTGVIANVNVVSKSAVITVDPVQIGLGTADITACPVSPTGQPGDSSTCTNALSLIVGTLPGTVALETRDTDGGHALWYMDTIDGGTHVYSAPADQSQAAGVPHVQASPDAGYIAGTLHEADTVNSVFAVRSDSSGIDRFDCAGGCRTSDFLSGSAPGKIRAVAAGAVAVDDQNGFALFGPATHSGPLVTADTEGLQPVFALEPVAAANGAIIAVLSHATVASTTYETVIYHQALGTPQKIGGEMGALPIVTTYPSGEFVVQYTGTSIPAPSRPQATAVQNNFLVAGKFDGHTLTLLQSPHPVNVLTATPDFVVAQPGVIAGTIDEDPDFPGQQFFLLDIAAGSFSRPARVSCPPQPVQGQSCTGPVALGGVRSRLGLAEPAATSVNGAPIMGGNWQAADFAISEDQLKAIVVTSDYDSGNFSSTLRLIDLATSNSLVLYESPLLIGEQLSGTGGSVGGSAFNLAPHFVSSAAGTVLTVGGRAPAPISSTPVVIWSELLEFPSAGADIRAHIAAPVASAYARIFYSRYQTTANASAAVLVDRLAFFDPGRPDFYVSSAAANAIFFTGVSPAGSALNLYAAPLDGTAASSLVMDQFSSYRVREDTKRIAVARADGVLFAGPLAAANAQGASLKPIMSGAFGGTPTLNETNPQDYLPQMDFTPDGDHVWANTQFGGDPFQFPSTSVLAVVDVDTGARVNYGSSAFTTSGGYAPVGFLANGQMAVSQQTYEVEDPTSVIIWAAGAANGTGHQLYQSSSSPNSATFHFAHSLDDTEGYVFDTVGYGGAFSGANAVADLASADPSLYGGNFLLPTGAQIVLSGPPSSYSPYGMPYAAAWDILSSAPAQLPSVVRPQAAPALAVVYLKTWGGTLLPPQPIANFNPAGAGNLRTTPDNTELLVGFIGGDGPYARRLRLNGLTPATKPLP